jgi:hypothetical protein
MSARVRATVSPPEHFVFQRRARNRLWFAPGVCAVTLAALSLVLRMVADAPPATNPSGIPNTTSGIHVAQVFNYNIQPKSAERGIDFVWGSEYARGPGRTYNTYYITFDRANTGSSVLTPNAGESTAWFTAHMPTFVEYTCDRVTPAYEFSQPQTPLDIADPSVQQWQWSAEVLPALAAGWPGIAFDNFALANGAGEGQPRCGHYDAAGNWVSQYSGQTYDPTYAADVIAWARQMRARIHAYKAGDTFGGNFSYDFGQPMATNVALMKTFDVIIDERGFSNWGHGSYPTLSEWNEIVHAIDVVQAAGTCYVENDAFPEPSSRITTRERLWAVANYMLTQSHCTFLAISGSRGPGSQDHDYGVLLSYPEYRLPIGQPLGGRYTANGLYARRFSGALALVNPTTATRRTKLPNGVWVDAYGRPVRTEVTLAPDTATVLMLQSPKRS